MEKRRLTVPLDACAAELARVTHNGRAYWSMAFEATGEAALRAAAEHLLAEKISRNVAQRLTLDSSLSYPRWLLEVQTAG